jgi:hypothetical protein
MDAQIKEKVEKLYTINEYGFRHQVPEAVADPDLVEYFVKNYNIKTDIHRTCINCQIRQITKYEDKIEESDEFRVRCDFIPRGLPKGSASKIKEISQKSDIPIDRAKKLLLSTVDPVAWAELMFGFSDEDERWQIRSYQKEQVRCTAKRTAWREGRRSGKTFAAALKLLYYTFNLRVLRGRDAQGNDVILGPEIMIVTPYQAQLTNLFEEIESLIKRNVDLRQEVSSGTTDSLYIKTPNYKMEFKNGAVIKGFVSGLGMKADGSGGGTMRGQSAHVIYLDEMDMIPEEIIDKVVSPILATTPDTILIATSTPIGKRAKFYNWCLNRSDFKEDFYPTNVLPHWDKIKDEILEESTKESFEIEYMAQFIEGQYGVFRPSWIHSARADYEYYDGLEAGLIKKDLGVSNPAEMIISIGIDWNKNAGSEFVVTGYSPSNRHWYALDAVNVPAGEYSSKKWADEVIALNYKWKPSWIYADEGYGHTIIEDLLLYAHNLKAKQGKTPVDMETVQLSERLIAFNFSKNVILRDPTDGTEIKKPGKHYLVENAVRIFEEGLFFFPYSDLVLAKQLMNYIVLRRHASTNKPVYGVENERVGDHRLDAMMLSLAALTLEESVYSGKALPICQPSFVGRNNSADDYTYPPNEARNILQSMQKHKVPGALHVLEIMRGGGSEEEDRAVKELYKKQGIWPTSTGKSRPNRGNLTNRTQQATSVLEGLRQNNSGWIPLNSGEPTLSSPQRRGPKRGNIKNRSWRKK